jgi:hypothetical protein
MRKRKLIIGGVVVVAVTVIWYFFRPELLFVDSRVSEAFPTEASKQSDKDHSSILATGEFHSVAHESKGTATIHQLADGKRLLRLTNFETSNGPAVYVYLVAAKDAQDNDTVKYAETLNLGTLKGNKGDQNYEVPADIDFAKYQAVTIWCKRFSVNFATAPLKTQGGAKKNGEEKRPA